MIIDQTLAGIVATYSYYSLIGFFLVRPLLFVKKKYWKGITFSNDRIIKVIGVFRTFFIDDNYIGILFSVILFMALFNNPGFYNSDYNIIVPILGMIETIVFLRILFSEKISLNKFPVNTLEN